MLALILYLQWARQLGELSTPTVNVPLHSTQNFYIITKPFDGNLTSYPLAYIYIHLAIAP